MPLAIAGHVVQPYHYQAIAEYDEARGKPTGHLSAHGTYTARQINEAITWWNERAASLEFPAEVDVLRAEIEHLRAWIYDECPACGGILAYDASRAAVVTDPAGVEELEAPLRQRAEEAAERIRALVAEDERLALYAGGRPWRVACDCGAAHEDDCFVRRIEGPDIVIYDEGGHDEDQARHIVRQDPAHVLARSATLLDVLADLERIAERSDHPDPRSWARTAICGLAQAWELDDATAEPTTS
jgi:hypothetical protein